MVLFIRTSMPNYARAGDSHVQAGPWITNVSEHGATVLWTTHKPCKAMVELEDGRVVWETFAGRRIYGHLHSVRLEGLEPGRIVRYRIGGEELISDDKPRDPVFGEAFLAPWHQFRTFDHSSSVCRFTMINDIHMKVDEYEKLACAVDSASTDFIFLGGDIVTAGNYCLDTLVRYSIVPLGSLAAGVPLVFARGNHEGRGSGTALVKSVYPNDGPGFYYAFRQGPVAFVVLDQGETHPSRSKAYCGSEVFESYLEEQVQWLAQVTGEPFFRKAPVKVCLIHVGMFDHSDKSDFHLQRWMNVNLVPILNKAGIDLMLSADLHEYRFDASGTCGNSFPILSNDDVRRLEFSSDGKTTSIVIYNSEGKQEHSLTFENKCPRL